MEIKTSYIDNKKIMYVEFEKNKKILKLFAQNEGQPRKSLEEFCKENNGAVAINGGLFVFSNSNTQYIDGIYTNGMKKEGNKKTPVLICTQDNTMWLDIETNINKDIKWFSWARTYSHYIFLYNNEIGYFNQNLIKETNYNSIPSVYKNADYRTMIGTNGQKIIIACSADKITGEQQGRFLKNLGCVLGINFDGNGSSQMYDGTNKKYVVKGDGRKISDAFIIWNTHPVPPTGDKNINNLKVRLHSGSVNILNREITGTKKITVPIKEKIDVIGLYGWPDSNGYRWAWGSYKGVEGAFKYDPRIMIIEGKPTENYKMKLTGSAARLRETVVNGRIKTTVPNGSEIKIIEFLKSVQSDGYQWCYGVYNGIYGYFQYDTGVMYPTND